MEVMLDSGLVIAHERGRFDLVNWLSRRPDAVVSMSTIAVAELWKGVEEADSPGRRDRRVTFLNRFPARRNTRHYGNHLTSHHRATRRRQISDNSQMRPTDRGG